jgi:Restriction endonuclease
MFRRGRRHVAQTELSLQGVDEQPFWLAETGVEPEPLLVAPKATQLRYDTRPWLTEERPRKRRRRRPRSPSPLHGVSTEEVIEALGSVFSPIELDWELVGVTFVHVGLGPATPADLPSERMLDEPPWAAEARVAPADMPQPAGIVPVSDHVIARRKQREWVREHDEIMAAVGALTWDGYRALIADIFRREGYDVFGGEGPDADVIDMEVVRGSERMLVNCQLRGLGEVRVEPLSEMEEVVRRSGADGVFIISDGDFAPDAWSRAQGQALILIDRETLLGLVLDFTLGAGEEKGLGSQLRRLLSTFQPRPRQWTA